MDTNNSQLQTAPLGPEQAQLFQILENTNETAFITGKAGTGKSHLLNYFVEHSKKKIAVVAPTGVAAINVHGQTIHSFFQLDPYIQVLDEDIKLKRYHAEILRAIDTLVIDEVSMVRSDIMEAINYKLKKANYSDLPFGGKQVVMFGDPFQLPPVAFDREAREFFGNFYDGIFFFSAPVFDDTALKVYELSHVYRQRDQRFIDLLNRLRIGTTTEFDIACLNGRHLLYGTSMEGVLTVTCTNKRADEINATKLAGLNTPEHTFRAEMTGDDAKGFPVDLELKLKVGAQIMMLRNDNEAREFHAEEGRGPRWVNGTLGVVAELGEDKIVVAIDGARYTLQKETWEKTRYRYSSDTKGLRQDVVASCKQYPVKLAWAVTIHKSQGQTYQRVAIDFGRGAFEDGQAYVAFSRCVDLNSLYMLSPVLQKDIKVNKEVLKFMSGCTRLESPERDVRCA